MKQKGFTLIELMVAMVIIGILTTVATVNYEKVRAKSRDSKRKTDLANIAISLDSYYFNQRKYPGKSSGCGNSGRAVSYTYTSKYRTDGTDCLNSDNTPMNQNQWIPDMKNYLSKIPIDTKQNLASQDYCISNNPCSGNMNEYFYNYQVNPAGQKFILLTRLENPSDPDAFNNDTSCTNHILPYDFQYCGSADPQPRIKGYPMFILY